MGVTTILTPVTIPIIITGAAIIAMPVTATSEVIITAAPLVVEQPISHALPLLAMQAPPAAAIRPMAEGAQDVPRAARMAVAPIIRTIGPARFIGAQAIKHNKQTKDFFI